MWEDQLKHSPEFASSIGDKRYNDQLTDYSVKEVNASLARGLGYIQRLGEIDTTGLTDQEKLSSELMLRSLIEDQDGAKFKEWEMPVNQFGGFHIKSSSAPKPVAVRLGQRLRRLHCAVEEGSDRLLADHDKYAAGS